MNLTSNFLTKRIHSLMRWERAPENEGYYRKRRSTGNRLSENETKLTIPARSMYPIAVRLDTWLPQSEFKDQSEASRARSTRQIRRKSKTHKAN